MSEPTKKKSQWDPNLTLAERMEAIREESPDLFEALANHDASYIKADDAHDSASPDDDNDKS